MSNFPAVNGKQVVRALLNLGFQLDRVVGSHHIMVKQGLPSIPVPVHGSKILPAGTLGAIIRMAGVAKKKFFENL
ncbi:MAG TPA: type II toxin-antitoxin system HicA family toxin [Bryobacteraceae bacterium]|jgi:predicted RNA binding protein YcfA (HicA-like mRNA interferase family)|nr:type II toxin-antitoxin system HicA family toxin [Bryobacteraceae bacterium]